jgi:hypothetical protein
LLAGGFVVLALIVRRRRARPCRAPMSCLPKNASVSPNCWKKNRPMIEFWLSAGLLLLAALSFLLIPILRGRRRQQEEDRTALNVALYQERRRAGGPAGCRRAR